MNPLKQLFLSVFIFCSLSVALAQDKDATPYLTKSFSPTGLTQVHVSTSGGNISIGGQTSGDARIEVYVRGSNWKQTLSDAEIKERLKDYEITIDKNATTLTATAKRISKDWNWKTSLSVSFKIYVPSAVASTANTSGGNITLMHLQGNQTAKTSGGNINLTDLKGTLNIGTSGGNIHIAGFSGVLAAETSGGNIEMKNSSGDIKVGTSGGNIRMAHVTGSLDAHTSGGNVSAEIATLDKYLKLSTSGGNIQVTMPMSKGMDLDITGDKVAVAMQNFNGTVKNDMVKGKLNGGGIPVKISTSGGSVRVN